MNFILELLSPKRCVGCSKFGTYFCDECISNILQKDLVCPECTRAAIGGQTHPLCRKRYGLEGLWSLGLYEGPLREAIKQIKYRFAKDLAKTLMDIVIIYWAMYQPFLLERIKRQNGKNWVVIPVPLHSFRKNWRGFNQSELLGQDLSKRLGLSYSNSLKRIRYTKPQVKLKGEQRRQNMRGAFEVSSYEQLAMSNVLLIDDVWTTGSTLRECAYILKKAGAKQVWAITLAR